MRVITLVPCQLCGCFFLVEVHVHFCVVHARVHSVLDEQVHKFRHGNVGSRCNCTTMLGLMLRNSDAHCSHVEFNAYPCNVHSPSRLMGKTVV